MNYLKDKQYYVDRYDLGTIEEGLRWYWDMKDSFEKHRGNEEFKDDTKEEFDEEVEKVLHRLSLAIKTQRYQNKNKTIDEWIEEDRVLQNKQDNTPEPKDIKCQKCGGETKLILKDLHDTYEKNSFMLFMFECIKCQKRRSVKEDGSEWIYEKPKCPKCKSILKSETKDVDNIMTTTDICPKCSYKNIDVYDFNKSKKEREIKEKRDKMLLEKYRNDFCYSEKEGEEMIALKDAIEFGNEVYEYEKSKYYDPTFEKVAQLKKLGITELEKLLNETLEKENYIKFSTDKPEIDRFVIVPFSIQDGDNIRNRRNNLSDLEKLIKKTIENTNWRLLSGSLMSRLGFISGRLKGYERDEDLLEISGYKKEKEKKKLDPEKLAKYAGNNVVQLAKMSGEFAGVESMRKRRLLKEPEGFFLEASEGGNYTCAICREQTPGDRIWWTPEAIRCADCWRNIKEGVIPPLNYDLKNKKWIKEWQIQSDYGVHPATRKKMEREGVLHPRQLKNEAGMIYCTVYLVEENKEFLEKYPKVKKVWPKAVVRDSEGKEIEL